MISFESFISKLHSFSWFRELLKRVGNAKLEGKAITDIYIREGYEVYYGILKTMFPEPVKNLDQFTEKISGKDIRDLVDLLLEIRRGQLRAKENSIALTKPVFSFSIMIDRFGVLRITYSRSMNGDVLAVRLLDFTIPTMQEVGLSAEYTQFLMSLLKPITLVPLFKEGMSVRTNIVSRGGLIIHCGATGSGKTTSMAAQIDFLSKNIGGMIITYEDPVEYVFIGRANVLQYELGEHLTEDDIYDHFLRATAQVGLVGEARKIENMAKIVDLASRGHLIYTTMHAGSVVEALYILKNAMRENLPLLAGTLTAITHQRLEYREGKIKPVYTHLLFRDTDQVSQIRKLIEEDKGYQDFVNFFVNNSALLKQQKVLLTQSL